jgi:hypothetical protein
MAAGRLARGRVEPGTAAGAGTLTPAMTALDHALLGASVVALAIAGLRLASTLVERGLARALSAAALATGAAAFSLLPRPAVSPAYRPARG